MLSTVAGLPALFELLKGQDVFDTLSRREARILVGALNFHALTAPGRELDVHAYDGDDELSPRTTDDRTFDGRSRVFRHRRAGMRIRSSVPPDPARPCAAGPAALIGETSRHLYISHDAVLTVPPRRWVPTDPVRKALRRVRARHPLVYDEARDLELLRHRLPLVRPVARHDVDAEFGESGRHAGFPLLPVPDVPVAGPKAVLIGVHWFELGGAERWAFETVRIVREAGLLPIVISNIDSQHPLIDLPQLEGAVVIPFSQPTWFSQTPGAEEFLTGILRTFDVRGVLVHHNSWLYERLAWIKRSRPRVPVVDSTHIVEYRGGGYPATSAREDAYIDVHHVISPSLARWFVEVQRVPEEKVVMAPLGGLTVEDAEAAFRAHADGEPFQVAFIGRMSRQKAPEVFIETVARLGANRDGMRFVMHGDGELDDWVEDMIAAAGLDGSIIRRDSSTPVAQTLAESHLLVVTSHNEGLTLTTLEAIAYGVPVISTDVGAQSDVVPSDALFSRRPHAAVRQDADLIMRFSDEDARQGLWERERARERALTASKNASTWLEEVVSQW